MAWRIIDSSHNKVTIEQLSVEYPNLVAYDESGHEVFPEDFTDPISLADAGYFGREERRILFWANEADSENDDGSSAIAKAVWDE